MEKNVRKNQCSYITFFLIIIFFSVCIIFIVINNYNVLINTNKNLANINSNYLNELSNQNNNLNELEKEINIYMDIDNNINTIKNEVYDKTIELENEINSNQSNGKIAYLTFDDGPYYKTIEFINILNDYGVKALFFTTSINGENCFDNKSYYCYNRYQDYINNNMEIGNHTYTHSIKRGLYKSPESFIESVEMQKDHIKEYANGYEAKIVRFPGGSSSAKTIKSECINLLFEKGYGYVDWSASNGDGINVKTKEDAWEIFTSSIDKNIEVILLHDYASMTLEMLPEIIEYLQSNNYIILPLKYESSMVKKANLNP